MRPCGRTRDQFTQPRDGFGTGVALGLHKAHDNIGLCICQARPIGEITAVVLAARAQQCAHAVQTQPVKLVDRTQHDAAFVGEKIRVGGVQHACDFHHTVQDLAVVHAHNVIAALNPDLFQTIRQHRADFRICCNRRCPDSIGIALVKLAEPARTRLFVAPDRSHRIAAIGRGQIVAVLGIDPRQRCGQVIAQGQPVAGLVGLGILLPRKHTFVGAVHIGKELAQSLHRLHAGAFQSVKPVAMIDLRNLVQHLGALRDFCTEIITKSLWRFGFGAGSLFWLGHWITSCGLNIALRV